MSEQPPADWTAWLLGALGTMALTIAGLGKVIKDFYASRVAQLEKVVADGQLRFDEYVKSSDAKMQEIVSKHETCMKAHMDARVELAALVAELRITNQHVANNTKQLKEM